MLTDPRPAPAEQIGFVHGLVGLAGIAKQVRALAAAPRRADLAAPDELVDLLLGVVAFGDAVAALAPRPEALAPRPQAPGLPSQAMEPAPPSEAYLR